ncbi:MAG TPA: universal stress protein [Gemmatimonadaceae bacterium]|jgi:nucleotide-binding universal stress UspA family protein|nr:universal stress protein [Gemmatimonadaceae bacterium]
MYKTIMVPTDCSGFDREAIRVALRIASKSDAKLRLVRVLTTGAYFGAADSVDEFRAAATNVKRDRDAALTELYALAAECRREADVDVTVALETGPVADALEGYAKRNDIDLIVISSHGRGGFSRLSLGSVTDSLIRRTAIPVLVVKPPASYLNPQIRGAFKRIVVPLDGSALAEQILKPITTLGVLEDSEIILLSVVKRTDASSETVNQKAPWWEKDVAEAKSYLARVALDTRGSQLSVLTDVVIGDDIAEEIAAYAGRERADLIAIATHGRGGLSRVLRGSVADALTRAARNCVLVFHPAAVPAEAQGPEPLLAGKIY